MEPYEKPVMEIIGIRNDIILTSGCPDNDVIELPGV